VAVWILHGIIVVLVVVFLLVLLWLYGYFMALLSSGQEVDQRKLGDRLWKKTVEHVD